jgi:hypothetical protein
MHVLGGIMLKLFIVCLAVTRLSSADSLSSKVDNLKDILTYYKLDSYFNEKGELPAGKKIKVAVIDAGFAGVSTDPKATKRYLPVGTQIIEKYNTSQKLPELDKADFHGRHIAQIIYALTKFSDRIEFRLYNGNGPENFRLALIEIAKWRPLLAVHARAWEAMGESKGISPIENWIEELTDEGVLFIQTVGNYRNCVSNRKIKIEETTTKKKFLTFDTDNKWFLKFKNNVDDNDVNITVSWPGNGTGLEYQGTDKDLDIMVFDPNQKEGDNGKLIASSKLSQINKETLYPREVVHLKKLPAGSEPYLIAIEHKSGEFLENDKVRVFVQGTKSDTSDLKTNKKIQAIEFIDKTEDSEIPNPAGARTAIVVGSVGGNSSLGPTLDGRGKPDILMGKDNVTFTNGEGVFGTSYSTAYLAGILAVLSTRQPQISREQVLQFRKRYDRAALEKEGWKFDSTKLYGTKIGNYLRDKAISNYALFSLSPGERYGVGLYENSISDIPAFARDYTKEVLENPEKYYFFLNLFRTSTNRVVKDDDRVVQVPGRTDVYQTAGFNVLVQYPGYNKTIPGKTHTIEGDPLLQLVTHELLRDSKKKMPWEDKLTYNQSEPLRPEDCYEIKEIRSASPFKKKPTDGTANDPKLWVTPTIGELK